MLCQETFNNFDQSHANIAACASCCERLLSVDGQQGIVVMKIDDLPSEFLLPELQKKCLTTLPQYIVQNMMPKLQRRLANIIMYPFCNGDTN
jgi:hypothetical protein